MKIKIINKSPFHLPAYETPLSAGCDVRADIDSTVFIKPGEAKIIPTGLHVAIPEGYECQVRGRSGLAAKKGIIVLNAPGTIDADYRGEIHVILYNTSSVLFRAEPGDRIAQLVIAPVIQAEWEEVDSLDETERGEGGLGHTGLK